MKTMIVTGSGGLIGGEVAEYFLKLGWAVIGIDNNNREVFFGHGGDTDWRVKQLKEYNLYNHFKLDIIDRTGIQRLIGSIKKIDAIVHCAAQPSHDYAASSETASYLDFDTNVVGTHNLLMAAKKFCPEAPFVFMSTNKVYGDNPNKLVFLEDITRWYPHSDTKDVGIGFSEELSIDHCKHSLFGAGKAAADLFVQEFGRYFNMPTVCLRGGCLTGPNHSGVELHGFLNYLIKCNLEGKKYTVFGYKGKQVRDNIHSFDVATFIDHFIESPRIGEVYNIGGGTLNSMSILEAFAMAETLTGKPMHFEITDNVRQGDHRWYVSNLSKIKTHYPKWGLTKTLRDIFNETIASLKQRA